MNFVDSQLWGAEYILGQMYENGLGVPKDREQAVLWYRRAAERHRDGRAVAALAIYGEKVNFTIPPASLWRNREDKVLTLRTPQGRIEKWQLIQGQPVFLCNANK